ncbi:hypothetical protein [Kineosporia mesophila]|uniref:hypothetical protein n=1 Tax=Kineosporia mesophila TaxID=566012 RepID=UPI001E29C5D2|nr:hypothetical protein [Kineosporia mesophila]MCD5350963.1 hypothetical protein [Kineosporia mesophila]
MGSGILVTRPRAIQQPAWDEHLAGRTIDGSWRLLTTEQSHREMLKEASLAGDELVIPDADGWLPALVALRVFDRRKVSGSLLLMRPSPDASWQSKARHSFKRLLLALLGALHPELRVYRLVAVKQRDNDVEDPVQFDPANISREDWLTQNGLDVERRWVVVLGEASERKCIDLLAMAMGRSDVGQAGWGLVVLGKPATEKIRSELMGLSASHPERVVFRPGFLTDQEFDTWVACADVVPVLHRNEGSSGVLLKCWAAGTFTIVGGARSVVEASSSLDMNCLTIENLTVDEVAAPFFDRDLLPGGESRGGWEERSQNFSRTLLGTTVQRMHRHGSEIRPQQGEPR